jgi:hypothetical protein
VEAFAHPAISEFEKVLRLSLQLSRGDEASGGHHLRIGKRVSQSEQPVTIDAHVVVSERHDVEPRLSDPAVARPVQPRALLAHVTDRQSCGEMSRVVARRRVIHHDDLVARIIHGQKGIEALPKLRRPVASAHDHTYRRWNGRCWPAGLTTAPEDRQHQLPSKLLDDHLAQPVCCHDRPQLAVAHGDPPDRLAVVAREDVQPIVPLHPPHGLERLGQLNVEDSCRHGCL